MSAIQQLLTDHIDIWTAADTEKKSGRGRASGNAGSVYGIKKLRELILELAVCGKLVPQDGNDEPASVLLKRIQAEKAKLIAEGKIKKDKPLPPITEDEKPFDLPQGWGWTRFGCYLDFQGGGQPPKDVFVDTIQEGYVQLIQIRDLGESPQPVFIPRELASKFCTPEDIMIGRYGASVGKVFWGKNGSYNVALVKIIDDFGVYDKRFLFEFLRSPSGQSFFSGISRSAQAGFNKGDIEGQIMPLPPLAEQHRIVAKIDELMALCDQLESQHSNAAEAHEKLVSHLLATLTQSQSAEDFSANWQRIAAHFDTLFTTDASIEALKQTLLQLAVMGKLVQQDVNDEPASELINQNLLTKKVMKNDKVTLLNAGVFPFSLPNNWCWTKLGNLVFDLRYGTSVKCSYDGEGVPVLRIPNIGDEVVSIADLKYGVLTEDEQSNLSLEIGNVLLIRSNGSASLVGKTALVTEESVHCAFAGYLVRLRLICSQIFPAYFQLVMKSPYIRGCIEGPIRTTSGVKNINSTEISNLCVSLPPLREQHRIVAKVDELMALCEQLKFRITDASRLQQKLADVLVEQAVA